PRSVQYSIFSGNIAPGGNSPISLPSGPTSLYLVSTRSVPNNTSAKASLRVFHKLLAPAASASTPVVLSQLVTLPTKISNSGLTLSHKALAAVMTPPHSPARIGPSSSKTPLTPPSRYAVT